MPLAFRSGCFGEDAPSPIAGLWAFLWFGLGLGIPLLLISLLSGALQRRLTLWFARHSRVFNFAGGMLLIAVALYSLAENWGMLALYYG